MIIQKTGVLKYLRYLGIFCAITMGFFSIVATSEDDVKDAIGDAAATDADVTYGPFTVSKVAPADEQRCETDISINDGLDEAGVDIGDIGDIELNKLQARYRNSSWAPGTESFVCRVALTDLGAGGNDLSTDAITIEQRDATWSEYITLTSDQISVINYYLDNRDARFDICVVCSDNAGDIETFSVDIEVNFNVEVTPEL